MPSTASLRSSIMLPNLNAEFRIDSAALNLIRENKFNGLPTEDPNAHLRIFKVIYDK